MTSNFLKCPYKNNCKGDDRKFKNDESFIYDERYKAGFCFPNYKGILCLECQNNFGKWDDFECESCFSYFNFVNLGVQIVIKFLTLSIVILFLYKIKENSENNDALLLNLHLYQTLNIFIQILNSLVSIEPKHFVYFRKTISFLLIFTSNLDFPLAFECFFSNKNQTKFLFFLSLRFFFLIGLFALIFMFLLKIMRKLNRSKEITLFFWRKLVSIIILTLVFLFSYTTLELCTKIFFCIDANQDYRLIKIALYDPLMNCESRDYKHMLILSIIILLIFISLNFAYITLVMFKCQNFERFSNFYKKKNYTFNFFLISQSISPLILNAFFNFFRYLSLFYYKYSVFLLNLIIIYQVFFFIITLKMRKNIISSFKSANSIELNLLLFSILFFSVFRIDLFEMTSKNSNLFDILFTGFLILLLMYHLFMKKLFNLLMIRIQKKYFYRNPRFDGAKNYFDMSEYKNYLKKLKYLNLIYFKKNESLQQLLRNYKPKKIVKYTKKSNDLVKENIKDFFLHQRINLNFLNKNEIKNEIEFSKEVKFSFKIRNFLSSYYFFIKNESESKIVWKSIDILSYNKCKFEFS